MLNPVTAVVLSVFTMAGFMSAGAACAAEAVEFDTTFLQIDSQRVDVARLGRGNIVSPGAYTVDISINDNHVARESVRFTATHEGENARACLTRKMLEGFGVDFTKLANAADQGADACVDVSATQRWNSTSTSRSWTSRSHRSTCTIWRAATSRRNCGTTA